MGCHALLQGTFQPRDWTTVSWIGKPVLYCWATKEAEKLKEDFKYVLCLVTQLCPTLCDPMDCSPPGSSVPGDSPGKNTGVGCHLLLQGIFPTQGLNPHLLHWQVDSLPLSHQGSWYLVSYCYYLPTADPEETKIHKVQPSTRSSSSSPQWDSDYFNALSFQVATDQSSVLFRNLNMWKL